ncbi:MAG: HEAT repeat domain-containing protein [Vicinamibacterales bacterium]
MTMSTRETTCDAWRSASGRFAVATLLAVAAFPACSPPPPPPKLAPEITYEQKLGWILRLEDRRVARETDTASSAGASSPAAPPATSPTADLASLIRDRDARIRRRAAIALGRVHSADAVEPLRAALADPDPDVRSAAAFGLGLVGDARATEPLVAALGDADARVRGRAAEALGLLGATAAAPTIAQMVRGYVDAGHLGRVVPDGGAQSVEVDALRLGVFALARLKAYDALVYTVVDGTGRLTTEWWPFAYALQRIGDPRALPLLETLLGSRNVETLAFAIRGLGEMKDVNAVPALLPLAEREGLDVRVRASAVRALAAIGDSRAVPTLVRVASTYAALDRSLLVETLRGLGALRATAAQDVLFDLVRDPWPAVRAAVLDALSRIDALTFTTVLSTLDEDPDWSVRAALAGALANVEAEHVAPRVRSMLADKDPRVVPQVLRALGRLNVPDLERVLVDHLRHEDVVVRSTAAGMLAERKAVASLPALRTAYAASKTDTTYIARAAMLTALASLGAQASRDLLEEALGDPDWAVRVKSASLLRGLDPASDASARMRPAPAAPGGYDTPELVSPSVSPHVFVDTAEGTIEIELAVLDAPQTAQNLVALARRGFFAGLRIHRVVPNFVVQLGDPRGDGEGGPGYAIRDELNMLPYVRGTVGMALDWEDTGGSQFFITHSPQPHLDARYTVVGRVVAGLDVVDRLAVGDEVVRVRVWDGVSMSGGERRD